jgi:DNA-binding LacI/PurR family transcriptional regulator
MRATTTDLARAAGCSRTVVSHVLNGRADLPIAAATRERVLQTARTLGYQPNALARALRSGRTGLLAVWVPDFYPACYARGLQALAAQVRATPYRLLPGPPPPWAGGPERNPEEPAWPVDGVLAFQADLRGAWVERVHEQGIPFVGIGSGDAPPTDWVGVDMRAGARAAAEHLLATHRRRIVFLTPTAEPDEPCWRGYEEAMVAARLEPQRQVLPPRADGGDDAARVYTCLATWRPDQWPQAFLCASDACALAVLRVLAQRGQRVPDQTAVVGCGGLGPDAPTVPTLTTLAYPFDEVARRAWQFLEQRLAAPDTPRQHALLALPLSLGESSAPTRGG